MKILCFYEASLRAGSKGVGILCKIPLGVHAANRLGLGGGVEEHARSRGGSRVKVIGSRTTHHIVATATHIHIAAGHHATHGRHDIACRNVVAASTAATTGSHLVGIAEATDVIEVSVKGSCTGTGVELLRQNAIGDLRKRGLTAVLIHMIAGILISLSKAHRCRGSLSKAVVHRSRTRRVGIAIGTTHHVVPAIEHTTRIAAIGTAIATGVSTIPTRISTSITTLGHFYCIL